MLGHIKEICDEDQPHGYTCPQGRVNFTSSIIWRGKLNPFRFIHIFETTMLTSMSLAIGPARLYSIGKQSPGLLHFFWIGALLPVITFYLKKYSPKSNFLKLIHWPLFFAGTGNLPPATGINYTTAFVISLIFNNIIKARYKHWWAKYYYILSASLDSGVAVSAIVIFFTVIFPGAELNWWGNNVSSTTADGLGMPGKLYRRTGLLGLRNGDE